MTADTTPAPAAVPIREQIEAEILPMSYDGADLTECVERVMALFAPVLEEKERERDEARSAYVEAAEAAHRLSDRARAAEAALAGERERCAMVAVSASKESEAIYPPGEVRGVARATADSIATAIRAQEP